MSQDKDEDNQSAASEEILDSHWRAGPLSQARQNLNHLCSQMLLQKSLRMMADEIKVLQKIVESENASIVDKVTARQTMAILSKTWTELVDQFGDRTE